MSDASRPSAIAARDNGGDVMFIWGVIALGAIWSLFTAARAVDQLMAAHAMMFLAATLIAAFAMIWQASSGKAVDRAGYQTGVVKAGVIASVFWGVAGFLVGVIIAAQLAFPSIFYFPDLAWTSFGRLRPLHTSAVIFAFGGNVLIATSFYVVQRTSRARLWGGLTPWFVFWGYNLFIVIAATGYLMGITQSKEYAEPEWYADLWLTDRLALRTCWSIWERFWKRKEPHIYVANWFYLAFIVTIAMLHIVNNLAVPVSLSRRRGATRCSPVFRTH